MGDESKPKEETIPAEDQLRLAVFVYTCNAQPWELGPQLKLLQSPVWSLSNLLLGPWMPQSAPSG